MICGQNVGSVPDVLTVTGKRDTLLRVFCIKLIGIEEERLPHIFDGTTSSKSSDSSRGLGIGLPICKTIISAHGGEIYAKNNENGGANFTFVLPMKGEVENVQQTEDSGCRR